MSAALDEMLLRLDELDARLRDARSSVLEFLDWQERHEIRLLKIPLFAMVCDAIYASAKAFHKTDDGWKGEEEDFAFYLWPGYESLTRDADGNRRVDLRVPIQCLPEDLRDKDGACANIECGISPAYHMGTIQAAAADDATPSLLSEIRNVMTFREQNFGSDFPSDVRDAIRKDPNGDPGSLHGILQPTDRDNILFRIMGNPCSLGFWTFLAKRESNLFEVGSTHGWLSHETPRYRSEGAAVIDGRQIRGVAFRVAGSAEEAKQTPSAGQSHGFLKVWLDPDRRAVWGPDASSRIKNEVGSEWPRLVLGSGKYPNLDRARDLYSLWLQTVYLDGRAGARDSSDSIQLPPEPEKFFCERAMEYGKWHDAFRRTYPQLADYVLSKSRYEYWYSLALDESVPQGDENLGAGIGDKRMPSSLGSLMLFSARRLDPTFLTIVRQWAENLYMLLREIEGARVSHGLGMDDTVRAFSHELTTSFFSLHRRLIPALLLCHSKDSTAAKNTLRWADGALFRIEHEAFDPSTAKVLVDGSLSEALLTLVRLWLDRSFRLTPPSACSFGDAIDALIKAFVPAMAAYTLRDTISVSVAQCQKNIALHADYMNRLQDTIKWLNSPTNATESIQWTSTSPEYTRPERAIVQALCAGLLNAMKNSISIALQTTQEFELFYECNGCRDGVSIRLHNSLPREFDPSGAPQSNSGTAFVVATLLRPHGGRLLEWGKVSEKRWTLAFYQPFIKNILDRRTPCQQ